MDFIKLHYLEILGTISGLVYIWLSVKQKMALWFVGILSSGLYVFVFFQSHLYADAALNIYYLLVSIYGWVHWYLGKQLPQKHLPVGRLTIKKWVHYLLITGILTFACFYVLKTIPQKIGLTPSSVPFWDALITSGSIVATWMLAKKILDQWLWWIVIDGISVGVFFYKDLYYTSLLFAVYTILAAIGYLQWKKEKTE
jgi:nicotinamide mononucleotide transporter